MGDINLTQDEADALIAMPKQRENEDEWEYPLFGGSISIPLVASDKREGFLLDISRGKIDLLKGKHQNRARKIIALARLDFGGSPHRNPDGEEIACPHLHLFREKYGDKWAFPVPGDKFSNIEDVEQTLQDFMRFCNIIKPPLIKKGLFI